MCTLSTTIKIFGALPCTYNQGRENPILCRSVQLNDGKQPIIDIISTQLGSLHRSLRLVQLSTIITIHSHAYLVILLIVINLMTSPSFRRF